MDADQMRRMLKRRLVFFLSFLCVLTPLGLSRASWLPARDEAPLAARVDAYLQPLLKARHFSGVILIAQQGRVVYEKAFGLAQGRTPNRTQTRFGVASITKSMTRALAVRLITERKLGLQDKLSRWLPDFPRGDEITVENLLRHRSGLPHRVTTLAEESVPQTTGTMVEKAKGAQLQFTPGARSAYSSTGFTVLTRVLELAAGKPYAQLLQEHIFTPAGMNDSLDFDRVALRSSLAREFVLDTRGPVALPVKDYSYLVGAGSVCSTARDVYRFGEAVLAGRYGESVKLSLTDNGVYTDNGNLDGYRCFVTLDSAKGYGFVVVSNLAAGANELLARDLPALAQGQTVAPPQPPAPSFIKLTAAQLAGYAGVYQLGGRTFSFKLQDQQLYGADFKLLPLGNDRFFNWSGYAEARFLRQPDGGIRALEWQTPTGVSTWTRVQAGAK